MTGPASARLRVNFTLKLLLSQNFCNWSLMRFISFASNIGPAAAVPAGPAPSPLQWPIIELAKNVSPKNKMAASHMVQIHTHARFPRSKNGRLII